MIKKIVYFFHILSYNSYIMKKQKHYVNNKELYEEMVRWKDSCREAEQTLPATKYIGESILEIAKRLATKPNFSNYTYKEEMIMDGVENCLLYMHNFDTEKYKNPFAYFTQIIYYAFLRRIQKEKKHAAIKNKMIHSFTQDNLEMIGIMSNGEDGINYLEELKTFYEDNFEIKSDVDKLVKKQRKTKTTKRRKGDNNTKFMMGLEYFFDEI
jgi:hypothetical protein